MIIGRYFSIPNLVRMAALSFVVTLGQPHSTAAQPTPPPLPLLEHETDPLSLRKSKLDPELRDVGQVLRFDVDGDGKPDIIETWWYDHRARWFDENGNMKWTDVRGDMVNDSVQIDRDDDGYYDGPHDITVKWGDDDGDGKPDLQVFVIHPGVATPTLRSMPTYMVFIDLDRDGVLGYIDWKTLDFNCWHVTNPTNFSPDYNGNSVFLKDHRSPGSLTDPRYFWENPFAFYDYDDDGCTEMAMRVIDPPLLVPGGPDSPEVFRHAGLGDQVQIAFDLDNDSQCGNEFDYDMALFFNSREKGEKIDFNARAEKHPSLKAPTWMLPYLRVTNWRMIDELIYPSHEQLPELIYRPKYGSCYFVFDEDDDDHRWERVEFYFPFDPYKTTRWRKSVVNFQVDGNYPAMSGAPQADSLGDRGEFDTDFSGGGKLYVGRFDHKIHLYGAEWGAWTIDEGAKYWGAWPNVGASSAAQATKVGEVVQYRDTDNNGFFDEITYDYDGDGTVDLKVSLLEFADKRNPHPDVAPLFAPGELQWRGLHELFARVAQDSFADALILYRAAWTAGLTDAALDQLAFASSTWEKYDHGYWLKERLFRQIDRRLAEQNSALRQEFHRCYFVGDMSGTAKIIGSLGGDSRSR
jgi:hypothetical protein